MIATTNAQPVAAEKNSPPINRLVLRKEMTGQDAVSDPLLIVVKENSAIVQNETTARNALSVVIKNPMIVLHHFGEDLLVRKDLPIDADHPNLTAPAKKILRQSEKKRAVHAQENHLHQGR